MLSEPYLVSVGGGGEGESVCGPEGEVRMNSTIDTL